MTLEQQAAQAKQVLDMTEATFEAARAAAILQFEMTTIDDDAGRLAAWAELNALRELKRRIQGPINSLEIIRAENRQNGMND
jgi:hypothetical protein